MDYEALENKPSINGVELTSGMGLDDIGISEMTPDMVTEIILENIGFILWLIIISYNIFPHTLKWYIYIILKYLKRSFNNDRLY